MGVELMHVKFVRPCGVRIQGSELLMDLKLQEEETIAMVPATEPNTTDSPPETNSD